MNSPASRRRFRLSTQVLEDRAVPSTTPVGPLLKPYTFTEVMASIRSANPIFELNQWSAAGLDIANSKVILRNGDDALVEVRLQTGTDPLTAIEQLRTRADVIWAEPNYIQFGDQRDYTPNDAQYGSQYHHTKMQNNKAWDVETGDPSIVVAILDDGVAIAHPDLSPTLWVNAKEISGNGKDDDGNGFVDDVNGWDIGNNDNNPNPVSSDSHGTHVAGITAARTDNSIGVSGVAGGGPNGDGVRIMPLRWAGSGVSWTASVIAQSYAYVANNGAKISNASYNFDGWAGNATVHSGLNYAYSKGLLIMQSAGNTSSLDPARREFDQVLFVASSDSGDVKSSFSSWGSYVDIIAPGSSVLSTLTSGGGTSFTYGLNSGTSMSTPNAVGTAALIWSKNPTWTREQVVAQLLATTDNIDSVNPTYAGLLGTGRANSHRGVTETIAPPKLSGLVGLPAENGVTDKLPTTFSIDALMRFDPASLTSNSFELRADGADNTFDTPDDVIVPLTINAGKPYLMGVSRFNFTLSGASSSDRYRFKASAEMKSPFGLALDGNSDGIGGDDFTRTFFVARAIEGTAFEDRDGDGVFDPSEPALAGRTMFLDNDNDGTFDSTVINPASTNVPVNIPDNTTVTSTLNISGFVGNATDVNVKLSITHSWDADLNVYLTNPTGQKVALFLGVGGSGNNFTNTVLDDQAAISITAGTPPFTGTFRPAEPLSKFNSLSPNGTWTLTMTDVATSDTGTLTSWSLQVTNAEPSSVTDASGLYQFSNLASGSYTVREVATAGWNPGATPAGGVHNVTITSPTDSFTNLNFAELKANSIYGRFYNDVNYSGTFDNGEAPLAGWTAFLDTVVNGKYDVGEPVATSAADGTYSINSVAPGSYTLLRTLQSGFTATQPAGNSYAVTMASGLSFTGRDFGQTDAPPMNPAKVSTLQVDDGTVQRSMVRSLAITFDMPVTLPTNPADAFQLKRQSDDALVTLNASVAGNTVTLTFAGAPTEFGSLTDGRYTLTGLASQFNGGNFDGNGDGTPGDDYVVIGTPANGLFRLFGDGDGNGTVNTADFKAFSSAFGGSSPAFDFDGLGGVGTLDFQQFQQRFGSSV